MIVLLNCSINCLGNNYNSSYGAANDSVLIAYDDLRIVNSKLIELEYEKDINKKLRTVIKNDSIIIRNYNIDTDVLKRTNNRLSKERNIYKGISIGGVITILFMLIK